MLEWIVLLDLKELYEGLKTFLEEDLKNVTKCAWYIKSSEEVKLYDSYAMYKAGVGVSFDSEKTFDCLKENIELVMKEYYSEQFSFDKYSFPALEFIICRYYGTLPRVKINE